MQSGRPEDLSLFPQEGEQCNPELLRSRNFPDIMRVLLSVLASTSVFSIPCRIDDALARRITIEHGESETLWTVTPSGGGWVIIVSGQQLDRERSNIYSSRGGWVWDTALESWRSSVFETADIIPALGETLRGYPLQSLIVWCPWKSLEFNRPLHAEALMSIAMGRQGEPTRQEQCAEQTVSHLLSHGALAAQAGCSIRTCLGRQKIPPGSPASAVLMLLEEMADSKEWYIAWDVCCPMCHKSIIQEAPSEAVVFSSMWTSSPGWQPDGSAVVVAQLDNHAESHLGALQTMAANYDLSFYYAGDGVVELSRRI